MRLSLLETLRCPGCSSIDLSLHATTRDEYEVRDGNVNCEACGRSYPIRGGILDILYEPNEVVLQERDAVHKIDAPRETWQPNPEWDDLEHRAFLSLPYGMDHPLFKQEGSYWWNVGALGPCFDEMMKLLKLPRGTRILEVGADNCWAVYRLSQLGYQCVALDITNHLANGDHYIHSAGVYFDRVMADMNGLPFQDGAFDVVLAVAALHHTTDLRATFAGCARVLRTGGRVVLYNEPIRDTSPGEGCVFGEAEKKLGINERWYYLEEWITAAQAAGFRDFVPHPLTSDLTRHLPEDAVLRQHVGFPRMHVLRWANSWAGFCLRNRNFRNRLMTVPRLRVCMSGLKRG